MATADITDLLERLFEGDPVGVDNLLGAVYHDLRRMARSQLRRERGHHTLSATALVHEAWLRLGPPQRARFENRAHFFASAAHAMRRILVDHARARSARKRHGERVDLTSIDNVARVTPSFHELVAVDTALERLAAVSERLVRVVECRYFAGLTIPETAEALGVSHTTVSEDWRFARAWLRRALSPASYEPAPCRP